MASWAEAVGSLDGRTALVTGASRGIGRATVAVLRRAGARVVAVARGRAELDAVAEACAAFPVVADVSDAVAVAGLVERAGMYLCGQAPDVLVNAAGEFALSALAEMDPALLDRQLAVNVRGPFLLMRAYLPRMLERGSGHVVTIGSVAGRVAFPHNGAYSASKFAIRGLHAVLDAELRGTGVRATLVEPAATDTTLWDSVDPARHPGLPPRSAMLPASAVADMVLFAVTRPPEIDVRTIIVERS
jgi:NADP-dependent 3-hydroxy acid dehydrogenase YdfG